MKQCLSVMRWQFGTWLGSARTVTAFLVCAAASLLDSVNLMQFARRAEIRLTYSSRLYITAQRSMSRH